MSGPVSEDDMAKYKEMWATADADKDGVLNWEEYKNWQKLYEEFAKERHGGAIMLKEEDNKFYYDFMNKISPEYDGIKGVDMHRYK